MELTYEYIEEQKQFISKLSGGVDPTTGIAFAEDTILNNAIIKASLKNVEKTLNVIQKSIKNGTVLDGKTEKKCNFFFFDDELKKIEISNEPITISHIAYMINNAIHRPEMKKLKAIELTAWLESENYLESISDNGDSYRKIPTEKGVSIGITKVEKVNSIDKVYSANLYNGKAQMFVIENLHNIVECKARVRL